MAPHEAELYCKQCHGRRFGPKGVGFGLGAGALTMDDGSKFGNKSTEMGSAIKGLFDNFAMLSKI